MTGTAWTEEEIHKDLYEKLHELAFTDDETQALINCIDEGRIVGNCFFDSPKVGCLFAQMTIIRQPDVWEIVRVSELDGDRIISTVIGGLPGSVQCYIFNVNRGDTPVTSPVLAQVRRWLRDYQEQLRVNATSHDE